MNTIIMVHKGNSKYLKYTLAQAKFSNPKCRVILLGDDSNSYLKNSGIEHYHIKDYFKEAENFKKVFINLAKSSYDFELFCMQRWFVIKEFLNEHIEINSFVHLDSDVLLYTNLTDYISKYCNNIDFTVSKQIGPEYSYFRNIEILNTLCDMITSYYNDDKLFSEIKKKYEDEYKLQGKTGGISDMTFIELLGHSLGDRSLDTFKIRDDMFFDRNIAAADGYKLRTIKKIKFIDGVPYVYNILMNKWIKVGALHMAGGRGKVFVHKYFRGDKSKLKGYYSDYFIYATLRIKNILSRAKSKLMR